MVFPASIIEVENGKPRILINDEAYAPMAFATLGFSTYLENDYLHRLGNSGIKLFFINCNLPWLKNPELDMESLEYNLVRLRREVPGAKFFLRLNLHPPKEWIEENPDELFRFENGELFRTDYTSCFYSWENMPVYSLVSDKWLNDAGEELKKMLAFIQTVSWGENIVGIFLAAGRTSEWIQNGGIANDYSKAFKRYFAKWLRKKYSTVKNLRQAWKQPDIDFDTVVIPAQSRLESFKLKNLGEVENNQKACSGEFTVGLFTNPEFTRDVIDVYEASRNGIAESIEYFANIVKESSESRLLAGAFHGTAFNYGLRKILLESKNIDLLANPGVYINRRPGMVTDLHCLSDSFLLHRKIYMVEDDVRTHMAPPIVRKNFFVNSVEDSLEQMKRDFGRNLCNNLYGWWFDMYDPDGLSMVAVSDRETGVQPPPDERGSWWYDSPEILNLIKQQQAMAAESLVNDCNRCSEIAVIMDERSTILSPTITNRAVLSRLTMLPGIGAPIDFYYCDDLELPQMPDYKLYIFLNTFTADDAQRQSIKAKVRRNGAVVLWLYASGAHNPDDGDMFCAANMEQLTGLKFSLVRESIETAFNITDLNHPLVEGYFGRQVNGRINSDIYLNGIMRKTNSAESPNFQSPNFYLNDPEADVVGRFEANNEAALAFRDFGAWRSVYCATQFMDTDLIRAIARYAGCHIVCNSNDFIFMNKSYLNVHAASKGNKTFSLPWSSSPVELYSGKKFGKNVNKINVDMKFGETLTFKI